MQFIIFFTIVFIVLTVGYTYVGRRLITASGLRKPWNKLAWTMLIILAILPPLTIGLEISGYEKLSDSLAWVSYVSIGFMSFLFTLLIARDIVWVITKAVRKIFSLFHRDEKPGTISEDPPDPGRRTMLVQTMNLAILGAAAGMTAFGVFEARRRPAIKEIDIPVIDLTDH
jgi:NADH:ubiquinone oxidoreductase subunit 5 (subunit L)/multisubunit Na+/H+ antiporter MnhA subunit